ncbi:MAG: hypothetical protein N0C84_05775 [Candidatus Thiodiazotropha taylori]|uniref:Uncharacterized protein n=1 Tax=Candidatus Thiodiazotropha taylori TaxID=2792791 RepID=A0A9E4KB12_9GAMM|nr:hypothetical protein [Candidatus Thiodiazotropha taylori]MCW4255962.1 hypothetical protein [Candidatus Thiodiazotropha taylori]
MASVATVEAGKSFKCGGRKPPPQWKIDLILEGRQRGIPANKLAKQYRVGKATIQRLEERADAKRVSSKMSGPLGAQYRISYTWYKIKGNLVFYWWEEFQEWISSTMEPSELRREGERVV